MVACEVGHAKIMSDIAKCKKRIARLHDAERQWVTHLATEECAREQLQQTHEDLQHLYSIYYQLIAKLIEVSTNPAQGG